jgi:ATP-dependent 26S proteasome regulatory subunit/predicted RNA-binding protein with TRAM domain
MPELVKNVDDVYPEDRGAGKIRLDPDTMLQLRVNAGEIVAIEGKRRTVAKAWRAVKDDWHQEKVRIDDFTRLNAGVSAGDQVKIRKVDEETEAKRVVLAPPEDLPKQLPINYGSVVNKLIDFPVVKNDSVPVQAGLPFMQPQLIAFKAVVVEPENAVVITENTTIEFSEKPGESLSEGVLMPEIYVKVDSAYPEDQGAGKARLDSDVIRHLQLNPGDLVAIEGKRRTVAKVWRAMGSDGHQGKVRIDNFTQLNAGVSVGDRVKVTKVELDEEVAANQVVLAPPEDNPKLLHINYGNVVNKLSDFPVVKNDSVPIPVGASWEPQLASFKAVVVKPENAVIITENTKIMFSESTMIEFPDKGDAEFITNVVDDAYLEDLGLGVARLDPEIMERFRLHTGDLVSIEGKRRTVARIYTLCPMLDNSQGKAKIDDFSLFCADATLRDHFRDRVAVEGKRRTLTMALQARLQDWRLGKVQIDYFTQFNAGVSTGDQVKIKTLIQEIEVERVVLTPVQDIPEKFSINYSNVAENLIGFSIAKDDAVPVLVYSVQVGSSLMRPYFVAFKAVVVEPEDAVVITENTTIEFSEKPGELLSEGVLMPEIYVKVDSAYPEDQGTGKARLDPDTMLQLRLNPGDLVAIEGKRRTVAKVWRAMVNDWHQGKVRIDNFTRLNAGVSIGDQIKMRTLDEETEANWVVLAPPEDLPRNLPINYDNVVNRLIDHPVVKNDSVPIQVDLELPDIEPALVAFKAVIVEPENAVIITKNTKIEFSEKPAAAYKDVKRIGYDDIGGLDNELQRIRRTIEFAMRPELFRKLGIEPPKGVLLYGPPGTGKTLIAKAIASESGAHIISIAGPEVISKYIGESEQRLREVFDDAQENAPSIIFIDEIDSIAPKSEEAKGEIERRIIAQLLALMDGLEERGQVVVIGATRQLDVIDPALCRPGRFDLKIEIGVPSEESRIQILTIHTRDMPLATDVDIASIAKQTQGFVGADLAALAREAMINAWQRHLPDIDLDTDEIPLETLAKIEVQGRDFCDALHDLKSSAI